MSKNHQNCFSAAELRQRLAEFQPVIEHPNSVRILRDLEALVRCMPNNLPHPPKDFHDVIAEDTKHFSPDTAPLIRLYFEIP